MAGRSTDGARHQRSSVADVVGPIGGRGSCNQQPKGRHRNQKQDIPEHRTAARRAICGRESADCPASRLKRVQSNCWPGATASDWGLEGLARNPGGNGDDHQTSPDPVVCYDREGRPAAPVFEQDRQDVPGFQDRGFCADPISRRYGETLRQNQPVLGPGRKKSRDATPIMNPPTAQTNRQHHPMLRKKPIPGHDSLDYAISNALTLLRMRAWRKRFAKKMARKPGEHIEGMEEKNRPAAMFASNSGTPGRGLQAGRW